MKQKDKDRRTWWLFRLTERSTSPISIVFHNLFRTSAANLRRRPLSSADIEGVTFTHRHRARLLQYPLHDERHYRGGKLTVVRRDYFEGKYNITAFRPANTSCTYSTNAPARTTSATWSATSPCPRAV